MNEVPHLNDHNKITLFTATETLHEAFKQVPAENEYGCYSWRSITDKEIVVCFVFCKNPQEAGINPMDVLKRGLEDQYNMISTNLDDISCKFEVKIKHNEFKAFLKSFESDIKAGRVTEEEIFEQVQMDIKDFVEVEYKGTSR